MNVSATYTKAVNTLKPNTARMAAIMSEENEIARQAKVKAEFEMRYTGKTAMELYTKACEAKAENESKMTKAIRIALLGLARKGK